MMVAWILFLRKQDTQKKKFDLALTFGQLQNTGSINNVQHI